jgi:hypothetical protein
VRVPAALLVAAALAGCGGGSGNNDAAVTAAEYRKQATRICEDANRRADALARPKDLAALRGYLDRTLEIVEQDTERLRRLRPPADLRAGHDAAVRAQDAAIRRLRSLRAELERPKPSVKELQSGLDDVQRLGDQADRRFRDLGLERCAD